MIIITVILAGTIAAFVLDIGETTGEPSGNEVTINTEDGNISTVVVTVLSGAILFLGKKVWDLNSEVKYLKGKLESLEDNGHMFEFDSSEIEEVSDQKNPEKEA